MSKRILDTSELIANWHRGRGRASGHVTRRSVKAWARELIEIHKTKDIVTPVYIEFIAGVRSEEELSLARTYLAEFRIIDEGEIRKQDLEEAKRLAARIPHDGRPRDLGDCLILAIAKRKRCEVRTLDRGFPRA